MASRASTVPIQVIFNGNSLFDTIVGRLGLGDQAGRAFWGSLLLRSGVDPRALTPDDLGALMPDVEGALRHLLPEDRAQDAIRRVRGTLFEL